MTKKLLIVAHQPSENTIALSNAVFDGANDEAIEDVTVTMKTPFESDDQDVLNSDAIILFTTENFGYMSGALKDFFDRIYYPCLEKTEGLPYALVIRAGLDGTGTKIAVKKIVGGLKWREVHPVTLCHGDYRDAFVSQCHETGMTIAAGLDNNIY